MEPRGPQGSGGAWWCMMSFLLAWFESSTLRLFHIIMFQFWVFFTLATPAFSPPAFPLFNCFLLLAEDIFQLCLPFFFKFSTVFTPSRPFHFLLLQPFTPLCWFHFLRIYHLTTPRFFLLFFSSLCPPLDLWNCGSASKCSHSLKLTDFIPQTPPHPKG